MDENQLTQLKERVLKQIEGEYRKISPIHPQKIVEDVFNPIRLRDQIAQIEKDIGSLQNKTILDVGCGYGLFLVEAWKKGAFPRGIEPSQEGFYGETLEISRTITKAEGLHEDCVLDALAEKLPFEDASFDVVHSANVLEHVTDPRKTFDEMVRVLKPGGYLYLTVPNYGSIWEGHYVMFWIPYLPKFLARLYVRAWGKDPNFVDTLQLINYFSLRSMSHKHPELKPITFGQELFAKRMKKASVGSWAGLGKLQGWINVMKKLHFISVATKIAIWCKAFTPLVFIARKEDVQRV